MNILVFIGGFFVTESLFKIACKYMELISVNICDILLRTVAS